MAKKIRSSNRVIQELADQNPAWTMPPAAESRGDEWLVWYFCVAPADCGISAQCVDGGIGSGSRSPDDRIVGRLEHTPDGSHNDMTCDLDKFLRGTNLRGRRKVIGLSGDGDHFGVAKARRIRALLARLSDHDQDVLERAYGPSRKNRDAVSEKLGQWWLVAIHTDEAKRIFEAYRSQKAREYQDVRQIATACHVTDAVRKNIYAHEAWMAASDERQAGLSERFDWFMHESTQEQQDAVRDSAEAAVFAAYNRWRDVRGRRRSAADKSAEADAFERAHGR